MLVTKEVARAGGTITLASKVLEEEDEVSPLRIRQIMTLLMTAGIYMGKVNTPHVVPSMTLNTKPVGTLFSFQMASLPRLTTPGDLCPHRKRQQATTDSYILPELPGGSRSLCRVWQRLKQWRPHREGRKLR